MSDETAVPAGREPASPAHGLAAAHDPAPHPAPAPDPVHDPAAPTPLGVERVPTGSAEVDETLARLAGADQLPPDGHLDVYEDVHRGLRDALTALDARPGPGPGPAVGPGSRPGPSAAPGPRPGPAYSPSYDHRS